MKRFFSLLRKENGAIGMEYAILIAAIACAVTWGGTYLGKGVYKQFAAAENQLQARGQPAALPAAPGGGSAGGTGGSGADGNGGTGDGSGAGGTVTNSDDDADGGESSLPGDPEQNPPDATAGGTGGDPAGSASGG